jgi:hypothetical protein
MRVFGHVLWVTFDVTQGEFVNLLGNAIAKRLKVPPAYRRQAVKVFQHTQPPFDLFFMQLSGRKIFQRI